MNSLPLIDLTGQRYGRLVVISEIPREIRNKRIDRKWLCKCDCGNEAIIKQPSLRSGNTQSCGCFFRETVTHHGHAAAETQTPEYRTWADMHGRCSNPTLRNYARYGGRGITVCERWSTFETFLIDMGNRPSSKHSLDRKNNDLGYSPDNCRWSTREEQDNNKSDSVFIEHDGLRMTLAQWARHLNLSRGTINSRRRRGWTDVQIVQGVSPCGRKLPPQGMKKPRTKRMQNASVLRAEE